MKKEYNVRDACFVCSSPYQVIGAIGIASALNAETDIYIFAEFPDYDVVAERISKYNIFSNVYIVNDKKAMGSGSLASLKITFFSEKTVSAYMPGDVAYKEYYTSSRSTLKTAMLHVLRKRNPGMLRVLFEDGMSTYSDDGTLFQVSSLRKKIEKLLGWDIDDPNKIRMMAYLPELVKAPAFLKGHNVEQMPRIVLNDENRRMLADIFSVQEEQMISEKFIIFDTKRRGGALDHLNTEELSVLDECYDYVLSCAGEDVICKPHPKSVNRTSCEVRLYPYQGIPMEALYVNMPDLKDRVLISHVSSAVFTPKILLDSEPYVICIHKLMPGTSLSQMFTPVYEKFRSTYREPERVYAPETMEELKGILQTLSSTDN